MALFFRFVWQFRVPPLPCDTTPFRNVPSFPPLCLVSAPLPSSLTLFFAVLLTACAMPHHASLFIMPSVGKECALTFQAALESSWHSLTAWASVLTLFLSPLLQFMAVLARAVWPHVQGAATGLWKYQTSLPLTTVYAEVAAVVFVVGSLLLRRFIVRKRYISRAQRRVRLFRARLNSAYRSFTASVERKFRVSARAFPHVVYWTAVGSFAWLAPDLAGKLRDNFSAFVTVTWPTMYALYLALLLRSQDRSNGEGDADGDSVAGTPGGDAASQTPVRTPTARTPGAGTPARSPGSVLARGASVLPQDVDRVLMYWVVFTVTTCRSCVPFVSSALEIVATPYARSIAFFLVLWMHLPGPGSGLQVSCLLLWVSCLFSCFVWLAPRCSLCTGWSSRRERWRGPGCVHAALGAWAVVAVVVTFVVYPA